MSLPIARVHQDVGDPEAEVLLVEGQLCLPGRCELTTTCDSLHRNGFALLDLAVLCGPRRRRRPRWCGLRCRRSGIRNRRRASAACPGSLTSWTSARAEAARRARRRSGVGGAVGDEVEALVGGAADAHDVLLRRAFGGEVGDIAVGARRPDRPQCWP